MNTSPPPAAALMMPAIQNGIPTPIASAGNRIAAAAPPRSSSFLTMPMAFSCILAPRERPEVELLVPVEHPSAGQLGQIVKLAAVGVVPNVTPNTGTPVHSARHAASNVVMAPWLVPWVMMTMAGKCWPASRAGFIAAACVPAGVEMRFAFRAQFERLGQETGLVGFFPLAVAVHCTRSLNGITIIPVLLRPLHQHLAGARQHQQNSHRFEQLLFPCPLMLPDTSMHKAVSERRRSLPGRATAPFE